MYVNKINNDNKYFTQVNEILTYSKSKINEFVDNRLLSRDSLHLRTEVQRIAPDINLKQYVEMEGEQVEVDIPLTVNFFWPSART